MTSPDDRSPLPSLPSSPASERNREPILKVLRGVLPPSGRALEIASGTGQHVAWFSAAMPAWRWQPTDRHATMFDAIAGWSRRLGATGVDAPVVLDVLSGPWPTGPFDLVYCANMLHIAPWECCTALMQGAARVLAPNGVLVTYGPYLEDEVTTAPGNVAFDADLRARDPAWGLRRREDVEAEAAKCGLTLAQRHAMPANNLLLVFRPMMRLG